MGRILLCCGQQSKSAYRFKSTGVGIYSIEELCYYIAHNIDSLDDELLSGELSDFIGKNLGLKECASKLERLSANHAGVKDAVDTIMKYAAYYSDEEIGRIIGEFESLNSMTPLQRKKRIADKMLEKGKNREAMHIYRDLLIEGKNGIPDSVEYGNILHSVAIIHARTGAFATAADEFREAYARNEDMRSLKQYLYALKLSHQEEAFDREITALTENRGFIEQIENELFFVSDTEENTYDYHELKRVKELKEGGKIAEYYKAVDELITRLKNRYRTENG